MAKKLGLVTACLLIAWQFCVGTQVAFAAPPLPPAVPTPPDPPPPPPYVYHLVQRGESLTLISRRYGVPVYAIVQANHLLNPDRIYVGQWLRIPGPIAPPLPRVHIVRWGETLSGIAWRYGVSIWTLARANGIWNLNCIYAGQRLLIPGL